MESVKLDNMGSAYKTAGKTTNKQNGKKQNVNKRTKKKPAAKKRTKKKTAGKKKTKQTKQKTSAKKQTKKKKLGGVHGPLVVDEAPEAPPFVPVYVQEAINTNKPSARPPKYEVGQTVNARFKNT